VASQDDIAAGQKIAAWNLVHGSIFGQLTAAYDEVIEAVDAYSQTSSVANLARLRAAGTNLTAIAGTGLAGPVTGVAEYDEPRRQGLEMYERAGRQIAQMDPTSEMDESGFDGAILLTKGMELTGVATAYTRELLERIQRG
jgi:hypothetical protein